MNYRNDWSFKESNTPKKTFTKFFKKKKQKNKAKNKKNNEWKDVHNGMTPEQFYKSEEWRSLRYRVIKKYGASCMCCGRNRKDHSVVLHVDHIKPRSLYPKLQLVFENLQVLCEDCNIGKANKDCIDYRPDDKSELSIVIAANGVI